MSKSFAGCFRFVFPVLLGWMASGAVAGPMSGGADAPRVLIFTKRTLWKEHGAELASKVLKPYLESNGFAVDTAGTSERFTKDGLSVYRAIIYLNASLLDYTSTEKAALQGFIRGGGGYVGIHASATMKTEWDWYGKLVGSFYTWHPAIQNGEVNVVDTTHPAVKGFPRKIVRNDEFYFYKENPPKHVKVLMEVKGLKDDKGQTMGTHPICWAHEFEGGRSFYTTQGHFGDRLEKEPEMRTLMLSAVRWAARLDATVSAHRLVAPATRPPSLLPLYMTAGESFTFPEAYGRVTARMEVYQINGKRLFIHAAEQ